MTETSLNLVKTTPKQQKSLAFLQDFCEMTQKLIQFPAIVLQ